MDQRSECSDSVDLPLTVPQIETHIAHACSLACEDTQKRCQEPLIQLSAPTPSQTTGSPPQPTAKLLACRDCGELSKNPRKAIPQGEVDAFSDWNWPQRLSTIVGTLSATIAPAGLYQWPPDG